MKVSDLQATVGMFAGMGFSAFWAYVASFAELIGGIAVLLGVFTRIGAFLLMITMAVAVYKVRMDMMMIMTPLSMFFSALALTLSGSGKYALMHKFYGCTADCGTCKVTS